MGSQRVGHDLATEQEHPVLSLTAHLCHPREQWLLVPLAPHTVPNTIKITSSLRICQNQNIRYYPQMKILWVFCFYKFSSLKKLYTKLSLNFQALFFKTVSVQFSRSVVSNSLRPHELQHARPPCPSPTPGVHSNSCPSSRWCHLAISSSVVPFSCCPQSLPASGSFPMSQCFAWGGQSIGVSALASVLPMNTQDWYPLGWTGWISLQSKGLSRIFSNTTVQKHQFFSAQLSL